MKKDLLKNKNVEAISITKKEEEPYIDLNKLHNSEFKKLLEYYDFISGAPTEYITLGVLTSLSGIVGKKAIFKINDTVRIYLNIWGVIIGKSTVMKKSTAINLTVKPLQKIEKKNYLRYKEELKEYEKEEFKLRQSKKKEEAFDLIKPKRDYVLLPQDSTVEGLTDIFSYSNKGLIYHHEFGGFLQNLSRSYSGDAKQFFTMIYDVPETYEINRIVKGSTFIHRPFVSILGASTIDWIKENSSSSDLRTGFFARFLYAIKSKPTKEYIPLLDLRYRTNRTEDNYNPDELYNRLNEITERIELEITKKAADKYNSYDVEAYNELRQIENEDELSFKGRLIVYTLKIASIIAVADGRSVVELKDIEDAIYLSGYFRKNIELLLNRELAEDEFSRTEKKVYKLIQANGTVSRSDLLKKSKLKAKELDEYISNLTQKELVQVITRKAVNNRTNIIEYKSIK